MIVQLMPRRNRPIKHIYTKLVINDNCSPKRKFGSEREALRAAEFQMLVNPNLELSVYRCNICLKWHLTRQSTTKD